MTSSATRFVDLTAAELVEHAIRRGEGTLAANGAFVAKTGRRTGRSPNDRFIVKESSTENDIQWGNVNRPFDADKFDALWARVEAHVLENDHFVSHLEVGADPEHYLRREEFLASLPPPDRANCFESHGTKPTSTSQICVEILDNLGDRGDNFTQSVPVSGTVSHRETLWPYDGSIINPRFPYLRDCGPAARRDWRQRNCPANAAA